MATQDDILVSPYKRLSTGDIRILIIHPSQDADAPICCALDIQKLEGKSFQALSYVWGKAGVKTTIYVNQVPLHVTWNLAVALLHLRRTTEHIRIWIDAVCINQDDIDERNQQVSMMHEIYDVADRVIVWLGPEANDSRRAISWLEYWSGRMAARGMTEADPAKMDWEYIEEMRHANARMHDTSKLLDIMGREVFQGRWSLQGVGDGVANWEALKHFFARPWWNRLWTFQEAVLPREIILFCGSVQFSWEALHAYFILDLVAKRFKAAQPRPIDYDWTESDKIVERIQGPNILHTWRAVYSMHRHLGIKRSPDVVPAIFLAEVVGGRGCSDPRDMVFGISGLLHGDEAVPVDYRKTVEEVYFEFARQHILQTTPLGELYLLRFAGVHAVDEQDCVLPSWVPDWRTHDANSYHLPDIYRASGEAHASGSVCTDLHYLSLAGFTFDIIQAVELEPTHVNASCFGFELLDDYSGLYPTGCSRFHALVRARVDDKVRNLKTVCRIGGQHVTELCYLLLGALYCLLAERRIGRKKIKASYDIYPFERAKIIGELQCRRDIPEDLGLGSAFPWSFDVHTTPANSENEWRDGFDEGLNHAAAEHGYEDEGWHGQARRYRKLRRLFRTSKGYFGTGLHNVRQGDVVCVVLGGKTPYVLRRREGKVAGYTLISEAFVHGIMDGEVLSDKGIKPLDHAEIETFDIY